MTVIDEIHTDRIQAIDRAARAVNKAASICFNMFLEQAAESIRLARIQEQKDYEAKKRLEQEFK